MAENSATPDALVYTPPTDPLVVVYKDDDLLALAKPSGLLSVPGRRPELADCLATRANKSFSGATIVHRLDMETSGVIVMARNPAAHRNLSRQFEQRHVAKVYIARVWGLPEKTSGTINAPLICDWPNRPRQTIDTINGRAALTRWEVVAQEERATRIRLLPTTGRSHQLRVHMASIGHSILGDSLYAQPDARDAADRLQLHAQLLALTHPTSGKKLVLEDPCPF